MQQETYPFKGSLTPPVLYIVAFSHGNIFFGVSSLGIMMTVYLKGSVAFLQWIYTIFTVLNVWLVLSLGILAGLWS